MNKLAYRVIFSKARDMLVVVSEATRSQGKSTVASEGGSQPAAGAHVSAGGGFSFKALSASVLLCSGLLISWVNNAHATPTTIIADASA